MWVGDAPAGERVLTSDRADIDALGRPRHVQALLVEVSGHGENMATLALAP